MQQGSSPGVHAPPWGGHHAQLCQRRGCLCRARVPPQVLVSAGAGTGPCGWAAQGATGLDLALRMPTASRASGWTGCAAASPQAQPGALGLCPFPGPGGGTGASSCQRPGLSALPPATWAGGWRGGRVCQLPVPGHCGPGGLLPRDRRGGCSCPVSHLHPCPLARCRGVIFATECAVPLDSGGLQGLCYRREAETQACG